LKPGQAAFIRTPSGAILIFIIGAQEDPVDRVKAKPIVQNILLNQARVESIRAEIKRLREEATVDYINETAPSAAATEQAPAPAAAPTDASSEDDAIRAAIEKGVSGLK
jgi:TPP-dependent pyruvate/acetoin dehydrogenase alpha subunit